PGQRHPTRRRSRSWVPGECPRRPIAGARSTLRRALGLDDFASCLRTLVGTAHVDEPLTLARVLALARVLCTRASPLALAGVDAATVHLATRLVRGPRHHGSAEQQTRRGARDQHALSTSVHGPSLELSASRADLTTTRPVARSGHRCCSDPGLKRRARRE